MSISRCSLGLERHDRYEAWVAGRGWRGSTSPWLPGLWSQPKTFNRGPTAKPGWKMYRDWSLATAERRRVHLHASRFAGVIAAGMIALLAIMAFIEGTVSPVATV